MTQKCPRVLVEICVDSVAAAVAAERGGAQRVELCGSLIEGGITPSVGLIETTRAAVSIDIAVIIRPRGGDFCYEPDEFETMRRDIVEAKRLGANAVVFGILDVHGRVDVGRTRQFVERARPLAVTFHRAVDMTADLSRALEDVIVSGADRLLTSGGEPGAIEGQEKIRELVRQADGRIVIMPGSGINPANARRLVEYTGVTEIHAGLRSSLPSPALHRNSRISMGAAAGREYERFGVREDDVRQLCTSLNTAN